MGKRGLVATVPALFPLLFGRGSIEASFDAFLSSAATSFPFYSEGAPLKRTYRVLGQRQGSEFPLLFGRGSIEALHVFWGRGRFLGFPLLFGRGSIEAFRPAPHRT